jgi:lipoprotein NlpD
MVGAGFVLTGILLTPPSSAADDKAASKPSQKRIAPGDAGGGGGAAAGGTAATGCLHVVKRGESVSRIAARYWVTRRAVIEANRLADPHALRVGQRLEVPGCRPTVEHGRQVRKGSDNSLLVTRVGPRRVLRRFALGASSAVREAFAFIWPVDGPVVSPFGRRRGGWHAGIDIKAAEGTPVLAAAPGTVYFSGWEGAYGLMIKIRHERGFMSLYAHNLQNLVEVGDEVEAGDVIATVGRTGRSTTFHLHFELRREGVAYNPLHLLTARDEGPVLAGSHGPPAPRAGQDVDRD